MRKQAKLITNKQMDVCNNLFELGLTFKCYTTSGKIIYEKKTLKGIVEAIVSTNGAINNGNPDVWIIAFKSNDLMVAPQPLSINSQILTHV